MSPHSHASRTTRCNHPHPDLLHLRDEEKADGTFARILDCVTCGRYEIRLDIDDMDKYSRLQLQFLRQVVAIPEEKVAEIRAARYAELRARALKE
jgi:hypothetical protein